MGIFRPWRQDARATWWARVQHAVEQPLDQEHRDAVQRQARATGLVHSVLVTQDDVSVSVYLLVKADTAEEAALVGTRVAEAAHREAGHHLLGARISRTARPHRPAPQG
jgi:hypothetical protein